MSTTLHNPPPTVKIPCGEEQSYTTVIQVMDPDNKSRSFSRWQRFDAHCEVDNGAQVTLKVRLSNRVSGLLTVSVPMSEAPLIHGDIRHGEVRATDPNGRQEVLAKLQLIGVRQP